GTGELFASFRKFLCADLQPQVVSYPRERPLGYEELLEEIPVPATPFAIVAESFSGPLGIRLAARHSDLARAVVLVASFVRSPAAAAAAISRFLRRLD